VVLREAATVSDEDLRDWINENVEAKFQRVREVVRLKEFPRNAAGKTLKREIRDHFSNTVKDPLPQ
jgi:long-chain acyl-CoA synthetase